MKLCNQLCTLLSKCWDNYSLFSAVAMNGQKGYDKYYRDKNRKEI